MSVYKLYFFDLDLYKPGSSGTVYRCNLHDAFYTAINLDPLKDDDTGSIHTFSPESGFDDIIMHVAKSYTGSGIIERVISEMLQFRVEGEEVRLEQRSLD